MKFYKSVSYILYCCMLAAVTSCAGSNSSQPTSDKNDSATQTSQLTLSKMAVTNQEHFNLSKGIAIEGYDPVSYFNGGPVKGEKDISSTHEGITYQFSSEANKAKFESDPESFVPAYGGWCAWAIADGTKYDIDPKTYKISDGKLLLFYNGLLGNTLKSWNEKNEEELLLNADSHWEEIVAE